MSLYKFYVDCGRMGNLTGVFQASRDEIKKIIGKKVYFGEVLGKFSDIAIVIDESHISYLTDDQKFIDQAVFYGLVPVGHNPFRYLDRYEEEDYEEEED